MNAMRVLCLVAAVLMTGACASLWPSESVLSGATPGDCAFHIAQAHAALAASPDEAVPGAGAAAHGHAMGQYHACLARVQQSAQSSRLVHPTRAQEPDGQRDFDWEIGTWRTHLERLQRPLTGSTTWVEYEGTSVVRKVWDGRANLVELDVTGETGRIEGLSLRLYSPETRQWSLNFANSAYGTMTEPVIGEFKNGRGEFYGQEMYNGRPIFVKFVIFNVAPDTWRFEQSFSADGGETWELNWIATDTRVKEQ